LNSSGSTCTCTYAGGTISVQSAGCEKVMLP
jgi:hypothetical protein